MRRSRALVIVLCALAAASVPLAAPALGAFPYPAPPTGTDPSAYSKYLFLPPGVDGPNDFRTGDVDEDEWIYASTPEPLTQSPTPGENAQIRADPVELGGVRGGHLLDNGSTEFPDPDFAWRTSTGRPDVVVAVLDSGIKWNDARAMLNLRKKTHLNPGEVPEPASDLAVPNEPGEVCSTYDEARGDDINADGVFNIIDFACDRRVQANPANGVGPTYPGGPNAGRAVLDPQDILIAFSQGTHRGDGDDNGYVDDIVGWDFLDDDNDPYDDVQYGHGTGEALDSTGEADNGNDPLAPKDDITPACANCMAMHMRVGDSFIADVNRFAQATTYAVDNGALIVQEALGTLNNTRLSREAVEYAYKHGVTVIASAADEAAQHNNHPSSLPHVILVNSVTRYDEALTRTPRSYLQFNGCTNFNPKITVSIPSVSCSSDAVGRGTGMAGVIVSAALDARDEGKLAPHPTCRLVTDGPDAGSEPDPCAITPNEVRQIMASGSVEDGSARDGPFSDDVNFARNPVTGQSTETSCATQAPGCTDARVGAGLAALRPAFPFPGTFRYPARGGHDQFYGWGRINTNRAVDYLFPGRGNDLSGLSRIPPEVEITSPEWYDQINPADPNLVVRGQVSARPGLTGCGYDVLVAPGHYPNNAETTATPAGDFLKVGTGACESLSDGGPPAPEKVLATVPMDVLRGRFPPEAAGFNGPEPGVPPTRQTSNGRPNNSTYGFVVKVVARGTQGSGPDAATLTGEDRRAMFLHRDQDMLPGFPRKLPGDGESSPAFVDLDGDNRNELVYGTAEGFVHAIRPDGTQLPGWPVRGDRPPSFHLEGRGFKSRALSSDVGGGMVSAVATADLERDGVPEVFVSDLEGKVYGWNAAGKRVFEREANPAFSGRPLQPFENVRRGKRNRTQHGFLASPVLADLDRNDGGRLEVIAAGLDRHVYAWNLDGSNVPGYPVLVVDPSKVASVDPITEAVRFRPDAGSELDQGAIVDTPAVGNIAGDARPEIVVGTNEEYSAADDGGTNSATFPDLTGLPREIRESTPLEGGNSRLYAIRPEGDPDGNLLAGESPFVANWPFKVGLFLTELLPVVGEGINSPPVIADLPCPSGGSGPKVGIVPAAGFGYVLNADATSCYGKNDDKDGKKRDTPLQIAPKEGNPSATEDVAIPAVGNVAFGNLSPPPAPPSILAPVAGLIRALDLGVNEYQQTGQDYVAAWDSSTGQFRARFPSPVNDLQFLTGPSVADLDGLPGEEVVAGTASMDVTALSGATGAPYDPQRWPKLTTDWTVATPLIGSFGTLDTASDARKVVVNITRSGYINAYRTTAGACSPSSSPRYHHDNANSGDSRRDAVLPGAPTGFAIADGKLTFKAPGDDLLCGRVTRYEVATSDSEITGANFDAAEQVPGAPGSGSPAPAPKDPGATEELSLPTTFKRFVALRAVDEMGSDAQDNVGRIATVTLRGPDALPGAGTLPGASGDGPGTIGGPPGTPGGSPGGTPGGGTGPPLPRAGACANRKAGTGLRDRLRGTAFGDRLIGGAGNDNLAGLLGRDCLFGGPGNDRLLGGRGADRLSGALGRDVLRGNSGRDRLVGGRGNDNLAGGVDRDVLLGGRGRDRLYSKGGGRDTVRCGGGRDTVRADRRDRTVGCERVRRR